MDKYTYGMYEVGRVMLLAAASAAACILSMTHCGVVWLIKAAHCKPSGIVGGDLGLKKIEPIAIHMLIPRDVISPTIAP